MTAPARNKSPAWCGPAAASVSKRVTGAAAAQPTCTAGGGVILLPPPSPAHAPSRDGSRPATTADASKATGAVGSIPAEGAICDAGPCPDCGAGLCAELVSYDPGTGETMYEARDYCAACTGAPEQVLPGRDDYDFGPTEIGEDWPCW
jgi:hypothetical protein